MELSKLNDDLEAIERYILNDFYIENAEVIRGYIVEDIASIEDGIETVMKATDIEIDYIERKIEELLKVKNIKQHKKITLKKYLGEW